MTLTDGDGAMGWDIAGYVFAGIVGLVVLLGLVVLVQSIPDVTRYMRIRRM